MATYTQSLAATNQGSGTTLGVTLSNVAAGALIVVGVRYETGTTTVSVSDGTTTLTALTDLANSVCVRLFYLLTANGGTKTYTATWGAARTWRTVFAFEFAGTMTFDAAPAGGGAIFDSTTAASGNMTTTGDDEIAVGLAGSYNSVSTSAEQINGVAADGVIDSDQYATMWYRLTTAPFTGEAVATGTGGAWACAAASFKSSGVAFRAVQNRPILQAVNRAGTY